MMKPLVLALLALCACQSTDAFEHLAKSEDLSEVGNRLGDFESAVSADVQTLRELIQVLTGVTSSASDNALAARHAADASAQSSTNAGYAAEAAATAAMHAIETAATETIGAVRETSEQVVAAQVAASSGPAPAAPASTPGQDPLKTGGTTAAALGLLALADRLTRRVLDKRRERDSDAAGSSS